MDASAILFDLHHTLTELKESITSVFRRISAKHGIDLSPFSDDQMDQANQISIEALNAFQLKNCVDMHWGTKPSDWIPFDRIHFEHLGIANLSDDVIHSIESQWHDALIGDFEYFTSDALFTIKELYNRGFLLGICTRRNHDPEPLLNRFGIRAMFRTLQWTGVIGFAKPNPYTLIKAAIELGVNPRKCVFVGNYVGIDIEAARRCEMIPTLLTWANPGEELKAPEGTLVFEKPSELLQVFISPSEVVSLE
ncbi:MAG: HAD family hydrolase [Candidatus Thorarchaeota archaeon]